MIRQLEEVRQQVICMIRQLEEVRQQVIYMYYYQGYTEKEIAKVLSISQQRVNQIKREALTKLKEDIE